MLVLVMLVAAQALLAPQKREVFAQVADGESQLECPEQVDASTIVVLDMPTPYDETVRKEVSARVAEQLSAGGRGVHRLTVFSTLQSPERAAAPVTSVCSATPEWSRLIGWLPNAMPGTRGALMKALDNAVRLAQPDSARMPVSRLLADISVTQYLRAPRNTITVFSDLLEDSPRFSLRRCDSGESAVSSYREMRRGALERPQFGNTFVSLNLAPVLGVTGKTIDCRNHFWRWFFSDIEGPQAGLNFSYLPGGVELSATKEETTR
ncbi:hypothetical protein [Noviherbaspirillum aridicola]|uniref:hypothetical protein n=1 Tax=Noviherbaspirillum aridicola TaxID=2849687 RepID=UPI001C81A082|nr:hypothetical protein [Noviherbaspirillum aridicola]